MEKCGQNFSPAIPPWDSRARFAAARERAWWPHCLTPPGSGPRERAPPGATHGCFENPPSQPRNAALQIRGNKGRAENDKVSKIALGDITTMFTLVISRYTLFQTPCHVPLGKLTKSNFFFFLVIHLVFMSLLLIYSYLLVKNRTEFCTLKKHAYVYLCWTFYLIAVIAAVKSSNQLSE